MKPIILTFVRYYLPGYCAGGPIRTIANMIQRLGDSLDFRIVALDRDLGRNMAPYPGIRYDEWIPQGKAQVRYVKPSTGFSGMADIVCSTPHDAVYLNSFFDPRFTQQILLANRIGWSRGKPIVIAPRGELSQSAMRLKREKKAIFIFAAKKLRLYDGLTWQASSEHEAADIRQVLAIGNGQIDQRRGVVSGRVTIAPDMVELDVPTSPLRDCRLREPRSSLRVCFLSRISPMKNLDFALRVLAEVSVPIRFTVYGPIEDMGYWERCRDLIADLPANVEVIHAGEIPHEDVVSTLAAHDLFFLPTRGENFGHVIHEAIRAGLPILISDRTSWKELNARGVGWSLPLDNVSAFAKVIEKVADFSGVVREEYATRARQYAAEVADNSDTIQANLHMFLDAIAAAKDQLRTKRTPERKHL